MWGKVARAAAMVALIVALIAGVQVAGGVDSAPADPNLRIAFIGTAAGADCVVVWRTGFAMMVGVADEPDQPKILAFLRNARISRLDYLVLPNPDRVHAELAAGIAASVAVGTYVQPYYQVATGLLPLLTALLRPGTDIAVLVRPLHVALAGLTVDIIPPEHKTYDRAGDYSPAVTITHGSVRALLAGEAGDVRLIELIHRDWGKLDLYQLPDHGRYSEMSAVFLGQVRPAVTVVSAAAPDSRLSAAGDLAGTRWFSSLRSTVEFVSDGATLLSV